MTATQTADEVRSAHANAEEEAVAAEAALAVAEADATEARDKLVEMEESVRLGGPAFGIEEFQAATIALRQAELVAEGARARAIAARGQVPDITTDLAIAAAKEFATADLVGEIDAARKEIAAAREKLQALVDGQCDRVHKLARALAEQVLPWS